MHLNYEYSLFIVGRWYRYRPRPTASFPSARLASSSSRSWGLDSSKEESSAVWSDEREVEAKGPLTIGESCSE